MSSLNIDSQAMPSCWTRFRRNGIRPAKSLLSTAADIVGDWMFYLGVRDDNDDEAFDKYGPYLFIFACISSGLGFLLFVSLVWNARRQASAKKRNKKFIRFGPCVKTALAAEIFMEDIPQFVLGALITAERGSLTNYVVFTLATSSFNFMLNLLDMIELEDEPDASDGAVLNGEAVESEQEAGSATVY